MISRHQFLVVLAISGGNLCTNALWSKYAAITPSAAGYYQRSSYFDIALLSIVFYILYVPMSPVASWLIQRFGMRRSILIGTLCNVLGATLGFIPDLAVVGGEGADGLRYRLAFAGQIIASLGQPFLFNAVARASSVWFGAGERTLANSVMSLGQPLGSAIVMAVTPFLVTAATEDGSLLMVNLFVMILVFVCSAPALFLKYRDGPPSSPPVSLPSSSSSSSSLSLSEKVKQPAITWWGEMKMLLCNGNFLLLWITFTLANGVFNIQASLISDFVVPHGYSEDQAGFLGALSIVCGLVFAFAVSPLIDRCSGSRNKNVNPGKTSPAPVTPLEWPLRVFVWLNMGSIVLFYLSLAPDRFPGLIVSAVGSGISGFILLPLILELGVENSYPVAEGTSCGFLMSGSQISATIMVFVSDAFRNSGGTLPQASALPMVACMVLASLFVCFFRNKHLRHLYHTNEGV